MRVVLDTNIWISGLLLPKSKAGKVLAMWKESKFEVVTSELILNEIKKVLLYPKIQKRVQWNEDQVDQFVLLIKFFSHFAVVNNITVKVERDPADSAILATLITGKADYLVTGDSDLLVMREDYPIIDLGEFWERIF